MQKKRWIALAIFVALLVIQGSTSNLKPSVNLPTKGWSSEVYQAGGLDQIALLEVEGTIAASEETGMFSTVGYNHEMFLEQLEHAFSDPMIKGIVLYVNSPGGGVYESDEIHEDIIRLKEEYQKPLVVYMGQMAASGGYYISAPADEIIANKNTITGSIGVIMSNMNIKGLLEKVGIKDQSFTSGENKTIMSSYHDMTEEQAQIIQSIVDEIYQNFVDVVATGRNIERTKVIEIADGRVYTALQAKEIGLVDAIGNLDDAFKSVADLAGVVDPTVINFKGNDWMGFGSLLNSVAFAPGKNILGARELAPNYEPTFMYLLQW